MNKLKLLYPKLLKGFIFVLGTALFLYLLANYAREGTKVVKYYQSGSIESAVSVSEDSVLVFIRVDPADFVSPNLPIVGDTLTSVNDSAATIQSRNEYFIAPRDAGDTFPVVYIHNGKSFSTTMAADQPDFLTFSSVLILQIIRTILALSFLAVGFWAFLKRPDSAGIRALTMFCYGMAAFFTFMVSALSGRFALFDIPLQQTFNMIFSMLGFFFSAFWLNLQLLFPQPKKIIKEWPISTYLLCYVPSIIVLIVAILQLANIGISVFTMISLQITIGFTILGFSHSRATDAIQKRQAALVLWGSGIGLVSLFFLLIFAGILFTAWFQASRWTALIVTVFFLPLLFSPLSFAYAFGRYRLLEVEGKIKRGTRYISTTVTLLAVFVGVTYLIGEILLRQFGIMDRTPTFMIALGLALGFTPAWRRMQNVMERRFYPERHHLRTMARDFLHKVIAVPDRDTLWRRLEVRLKESLGVERIYPVVASTDQTKFHYHRDGVQDVTPFQMGQELMQKLQTSNRPLLVDEAVASGKIALSVESYSWLTARKIALLLPLIVQSQIRGFLGLEFSEGKEDYAPEDLQILGSLASQVALASENIRLLEENIDKKRMEEELQLARRIQERFLPQEIPPTPGLKIAAQSLFCLEVAGDYYDVIGMPDGRTVLAVGDVSGKGAGAALLMANLQASLRTAIAAELDLSSLVGRINNLIFQNTPQEQYITFFVAVFDPHKRSLVYVNAGHNWPVLVKEDGSSQELNVGGLILGALQDMPYEQAEIKMDSGDLVLMFTDGISEAMNADEEEFGEDRILEYVIQQRQQPTDSILTGLEETAKSFSGDVPWTDDLTMLLICVE
ncbi:hypothetical protein CEE37_13120 [candidate division LCP-89 bacterium B3_LCP]|uniref:PPM-type phosphatase domain-containing protein n=1 Tax=candidate division LCP-89 bacterium B3_LCP TaxID=2012998 RepID=A0A532UU36_UNCL8|nr:MAG: hypothetical protein CEE37_13120 [candidate division LCP-89 bacterium B3_LCP]